MTTETKPVLKKVTFKKAVVKKIAAKRAASRPEKANYLTKRILVSAAKVAFTKAAAKTMDTMGYNVVAKNGWVIKIYADGRIEKISKIDTDNHQTLALD